MTNTWGKTKTKADKDKKMEKKIIPVKFNSSHLATIFYLIVF